MNKLLYFILFTLLCLPLVGRSQHLRQAPLQLSHQQTTSLIFPFAIQHVERGSADVLAQVPRPADNVLQVKAARPAFAPTNLTVITSDGKLYSFPVSFGERPSTTVLAVAESSVAAAPVSLRGAALPEGQLQWLCRHLVEDSRFYYGISDRAGGVQARLEGIYTYGTLLFYRVVFRNRSSLPYALDFTRSSIRDRRQVRRTATQEHDVQPRYVYGPETKGKEQVLLLVLDRQGMGPGKELVLQFFEASGGRHLAIRVPHRLLRQALPLWWNPTLSYSLP